MDPLAYTSGLLLHEEGWPVHGRVHRECRVQCPGHSVHRAKGPVLHGRVTVWVLQHVDRYIGEGWTGLVAWLLRLDRPRGLVIEAGQASWPGHGASRPCSLVMGPAGPVAWSIAGIAR